jgi:hypothetical protein
MARNRKNQTADAGLSSALKAILLCGAIVCACLGYVWQKKQIDELGRQMRLREARVRDLRDQNEKMKKQLALLESVPNLEQRVSEMKLGLVMPQPSLVWRLAEPAPEAPAAPEDHRYAAGQTQGTATP